MSVSVSASVSASTAARFKESAYKLVRDVKLSHDFEPPSLQPQLHTPAVPVRVLLAYRCKQASEWPLQPTHCTLPYA